MLVLPALPTGQPILSDGTQGYTSTSNIQYPLIGSQLTYTPNVSSRYEIKSASNGYILKYCGNDFVFESVESLLSFIKKEEDSLKK